MGVNNSDFEYMAHRRGDTQKDMFYVGAYLGFVADNKLRSLSGKTPTWGSISLNTFRTYARNNSPASNGNGGSGYDVFAWYQLIFIQCMYVLKYKNLDSQRTVGYGMCNDTSQGFYNYPGTLTGGTETKGMDWGTTADYKTHVKCFGIEDLWGGLWFRIDGIRSADNYHILTATENFNDDGVNYIDRGASGVTSNHGRNYVTKIIGTTHGGFLLTTNSTGSDTTYYCDCSCFANSKCVAARGSYNNGGEDGIFLINLEASPNGNYTQADGTSLMYV